MYTVFKSTDYNRSNPLMYFVALVEDPYCIDGVFSTEAEAEKHMESLNSSLT